MLKSIRLLVVIVAYNDYKNWKMDVKIVLLNGNLKRDVYMIQLENLISKTKTYKYVGFKGPHIN